MLREMRPSELGEWLAFYRLGPWGEARADLRMGIVASTIANVNRDTKKRAQPYRPRDFMPYVEPEPQKPADPAELSRRLLAAFGLKPDPNAAPAKRRKR